MSSDASNTRIEDLKRHSIWTLSAIGFLAYYIAVMWHEVIGHGLTMYLFGARRFVLTCTSIDAIDLPSTAQTGTMAGRLVSLDGAISNIALGALLYPVLRVLTRRNANLTLRVFLWLLVAVNIYVGFVYPFYSGTFGVADWSDAIVGLPHHALLRGFEAVSGAVLCGGTVLFFAASFSHFPESLWRISLIPYCSAAVVFCLAGLRIPNGAELMVESVIPAALLGQSILVFVTPLARRMRGQPSSPEVIRTNPVVLFIAFVFVVAILVTAPGLHFAVR